MTIRKSLAFTLVASALAPACKPDVGQAPSLVTDLALLAVRGEPAEAKPGETVEYAFLLASPAGTVVDAQAGWDVCETPKPPAESNSVAAACNPPGPGSTSGQTFAAPIPTKACMLFGPIAPPVEPNKPAVRPRDPDATGGYFLPVRVKLTDVSGGLTGFAFERITCNLANAASHLVKGFNERYQPNRNPGIASTDVITSAGLRLSLNEPAPVVSAGETITLEAAFTAGSAEVFPVLSTSGEELVDQRESLHMSWFASAGAFDQDRTGVAGDESSVSTSNTWTAPDSAMRVHFWIVLRDSRNGTAWHAYELQVVP